MQAQTNPIGGSDDTSRYLRLAIWIIAVAVGFLIPFKILSLGYIPPDDAMRHVGKALSGKSWPEILVMRPEFAGDEHPGWHATLTAMHQWFGLNADQLILFSVAGLFILFWLVMLGIGFRPETILLTLFTASLTAPEAFIRVMLGRPFIFVIIVSIILLRLWTKTEKISALKFFGSLFFIGVAVWMENSWYLYVFIAAGFALVREWKKMFLFIGCWFGGAVLGGIFAGRPIGYLKEAMMHLLVSFQGHPLERMMVTEFGPGSGDLIFVIVVGFVLVWRQLRNDWRRDVFFNPLFAVAALGWLLGLKVARCWADWGLPAAMLWLAIESEALLELYSPRKNFSSLLLACFAAAGIFIVTTRDEDNRWTRNLQIEYLTADNPNLAGWLPDKGGIVYSPDMHVFYQMFFKNPTADWRYILGYEPGVMLPEDLKIRREIQMNDSNGAAYEPWVKKMRPQDRMILFRPAGTLPNIPSLEWKYAAANTYIGRLPQTNSVPATK